MRFDDRTIPVTADDGVTSELRLYAPEQPCSLLVFHCGLGIPATYYRPFARALCRAGHAVALADARGVGSSSVRARRGVDFGYRELVERELPAAVDAARRELPDLPVLVGGHSLGAQVSVLGSTALPDAVLGLVLVAGGSLSLRGYGLATRCKLSAAQWIFPVAARTLGWFPGRMLGFGVREAKTLMLEWTHCVGTGRYVLHGPGRDWEAAAAEEVRPVLAITIEDDDMAPPAAMANLTAKVPRAQVERHHVALREPPNRTARHFRWARAPEPVVETIDPWIRRQLAVR